jgi:hypothetical protein
VRQIVSETIGPQRCGKILFTEKTITVGDCLDAIDQAVGAGNWSAGNGCRAKPVCDVGLARESIKERAVSCRPFVRQFPGEGKRRCFCRHERSGFGRLYPRGNRRILQRSVRFAQYRRAGARSVARVSHARQRRRSDQSRGRRQKLALRELLRRVLLLRLAPNVSECALAPNKVTGSFVPFTNFAGCSTNKHGNQRHKIGLARVPASGT